MSSTARNDVRDPDDFYATPAECTDAILPHLKLAGSVLEPACGRGAIVERLWAHGVERDRVTSIEIDRGRAGAFVDKHAASVTVCDFLIWSRQVLGPSIAREPLFSLGTIAPTDRVSFDSAIGNPPFRHAMNFIEACLDLVAPRGGEVAMLLRLAWLASQERAAFHRAHPSDVYVLETRPSFCASLRCKEKCGWHLLQELEAPRVKRCPSCDAVVVVTTSDSADYAWFVWGPGRGNRWHLLSTAEQAA